MGEKAGRGFLGCGEQSWSVDKPTKQSKPKLKGKGSSETRQNADIYRACRSPCARIHVCISRLPFGVLLGAENHEDTRPACGFMTMVSNE